MIADNEARYLAERSAQTLDSGESRRGSTLQTAALHAWGHRTEDAVLVSRRAAPENASSGDTEKLVLRRKCLQSFLERDPQFSAQKAAVPTVTFADTEPSHAGAVQWTRDWLEHRPDIQPIATILSKRSRFLDIAGDAAGVLLASLDTSISIHYGVTLDNGVRGCSKFPYGVLRIRQEGSHGSNLVEALKRNHLVSCTTLC